MASEPSCSGTTAPIAVKQIIVRTGRLICDIEIADPALRNTTPELAACVAQRFPDLPEHACVNDKGRTFAAIMDDTPLPHLLEHVAISMQTRGTARADATFMGVTSWTDESAGAARIELSYLDDLEALRAFGDAVSFLNNAVLACQS